MSISKKETKKIPTLRFPEFKTNWIEGTISDFVIRHLKPVTVNKTSKYQEIGIRSHAKGIFHKDPIKGQELGNKRVFWVHPKAFIVNIVFGWEQAIALTTESEEGFIASHRFPMFLPNQNKLDLNFLLYFFKRKRGKYLLGFASPGGAGRNKTLGQKEFANLNVSFPKVKEQSKIAEFLSVVDKKLDLLKEKLALHNDYKKGTLQAIYRQSIKFKCSDGSNFDSWTRPNISEILGYEQPTKYLVSSTHYSDQYKTPVLTAGKSFILGYSNEGGIYESPLPVIIFDDFTTATKYVDFPFKGKSSAMKILKAKDNTKISIKVVFEFMKLIKFPVGEHKRYWISEFQHKPINLPSYEEQLVIEDFIFSIDERIKKIEKQISKLGSFKLGLYQQLFV